MSEALNLVNITEGRALYQVPRIDDLRSMIKRCETEYGNHTAFRFRHDPQGQTQSRTFKQFAQDINAFGTALIHTGLQNSRIAIIGENRYEWVVSYLATVNGVGIAVPLDRMLPPNEIAMMLERGDVDVLVYSHAFQSTVETIALSNKRVKAFICMNPEKDEKVHGTSFYAFSDLLKQGKALIEKGDQSYTSCVIDPHAMSILLFTSGTSSTSKAVMLSHTNICADIMAIGGIFHGVPGESVLSVLPLHHTFENTTGLLFPLYLGMTVSISDGLKYLQKNLSEYKPDVLVGVPLIFDKFKNRIMEEVKKKGMLRKVKIMMGVTNVVRYTGLDLRRKVFKQLLDTFGGRLRVIITGGAAMDAPTANWYENIGVRVYQGYGLTETSPVAAGGNDRIRKAGTCGEPLPGIKIAIANPDATGSGEIVINGKTVMLGYWKNDEATKEVLQDGWFHTGDLGCVDKKGLIHVTGRVKSMIVLKNGKKVFPEELESHINKLEYVKESMVWGEAAADGTVDICAKIILDKEQIGEVISSPENEDEIKALLDSAIKEINKQMPVYKMIRYYVFGYDELIKTTTMKVKRYVEADQMRALLAQMTTTIKNTAGKNIDKLKEMLSKRVGHN
ncbi:MAG: AMP-binding protein [Clostridia bacterium]|nr:AMP-binding protein [Clostridia bacterium]